MTDPLDKMIAVDIDVAEHPEKPDRDICPECDEPYNSEYHFGKSCVAPIDEDQLKYGDL